MSYSLIGTATHTDVLSTAAQPASCCMAAHRAASVRGTPHSPIDPEDDGEEEEKKMKATTMMMAAAVMIARVALMMQMTATSVMRIRVAMEIMMASAMAGERFGKRRTLS